MSNISLDRSFGEFKPFLLLLLLGCCQGQKGAMADPTFSPMAKINLFCVCFYNLIAYLSFIRLYNL